MNKNKVMSTLLGKNLPVNERRRIPIEEAIEMLDQKSGVGKSKFTELDLHIKFKSGIGGTKCFLDQVLIVFNVLNHTSPITGYGISDFEMEGYVKTEMDDNPNWKDKYIK